MTRRETSRRGPGRRRGATLLEALFCLAILALVLPAMLGTTGRHARTARVLEGRVEARSLLEATAQAVRRARFADVAALADPEPASLGPVELPEVPAGYQRRLAVQAGGGPVGEALRQVTIEVRWQVGGRAGEAPRDHRIERTLLVADRTHSLRFDGVVGS